MKTLVYGIGNPGRGDDALGVLCVRQVKAQCEAAGIPGIEVREVFQLTIEEAERLGAYDRILFCDASIAEVDEVAIFPVTAAKAPTFPAHASTPEEILGLAGMLYGPPPGAYVLHLRGEEFGFVEKLSVRGERNLAEGVRQAVRFLRT